MSFGVFLGVIQQLLDMRGLHRVVLGEWERGKAEVVKALACSLLYTKGDFGSVSSDGEVVILSCFLSNNV